MQEVLDLYEQGNVDEAMRKLEDMKLEEIYVQTLDKKHKAERDSILVLNKLRTSVNIYKNGGNWDKAAETLKLLADKQNTFDDVFAYARFCQEQNDFKDAEIYYDKALEMRRLANGNPKAYDLDAARTLHNMAQLYSKTQRFTEAEEMYKQTLEIYPYLTKANSKAYEPDMAATLNSLAILYYNTKRLTEAEEKYKQVLEIRQRLAKDSPKAYEPYVAQTLHNLAILYKSTQRVTEAEDKYKQAMEIYQRIAKDNPKAYESELARTLNSLAILYYNTKRFTGAEEMYKQALEIRQRLAKGNPKAYEPYVAQTFGNLSLNAIFLKNHSKAEQFAREGLAVDSTQHWIASNLAVAILLQGRYTEAECIYRQYKDELRDSFLDDFEQFKAVGVIPKEREEDVEKIKQMLKE